MTAYTSKRHLLLFAAFGTTSSVFGAAAGRAPITGWWSALDVADVNGDGGPV